MRRLRFVNIRFRRIKIIVIASKAKFEKKAMILEQKLTSAHAQLKKEKMNVKKIKLNDIDEKERNERNKKNENEKMREASVKNAKSKKKRK